MDGDHLDRIPLPLLLVERFHYGRERALAKDVEQVVMLVQPAGKVGGGVDLSIDEA